MKILKFFSIRILSGSSFLLAFSGPGLILSLPTQAGQANQATQAAQAAPSLSATLSGILMRQGYELIKAGSYSEAIPLFDRVYWNDARNYNDALFYIIYCQDRLGQYSRVLSNLALLDRRKLTPSRQNALQRILDSAPYRVQKVWVSASGSAGGLTFPGSVYNGSGYFIGGAATLLTADQKFTVSYDRVLFSRIQNTDLSQDQYSLFYGLTVSQHLALQSSFGLINSRDADTQAGKIFGLTLKYFDASGFYLSTESFGTLYPNYSGQTLWVLQSSLGVGFKLAQSNAEGLFLDLKGTLIRPVQTVAAPETFSNQNYFSGQAGLRYYQSRWSTSAALGVGNQIYAVQNGGETVINTPLIRDASIQASVGYSLSSTFGLTLLLEGDEIQEPQGKTYSLISGLSVGASF